MADLLVTPLVRPRELPVLAGVPHLLPYQGSKRALAHAIVPLLPAGVGCLVEPFCGSAAVSLAALHAGAVPAVHLRDLNSPLVGLWAAVLADPRALATAYEQLWERGSIQPAAVFAQVRDRFNRAPEAADLLYLLHRIVKGAVRYNRAGEFNQGADRRRVGTRPATVRARLLGTHAVLSGRAAVTCGDYAETLLATGPGDVAYLDPPYQGTSAGRDGRYLTGLPREDLVLTLKQAIAEGVSFLLSYDGRSGERSYGEDLPPELGLLQLHVVAGRSSQATLSGRHRLTVESLYVSPALVDRLGGPRAVVSRAGEVD